MSNEIKSAAKKAYESMFEVTSCKEKQILDSGKQVTEIPIEKLRPFRSHPFKVFDDEAMKALTENIRTVGITTPIIVREKNGYFEIISGHRRLFAAQKLNKKAVPAIVYECDDDTAAILMVSSNISRPRILPSERAGSLRMLFDSIKHQGRFNGSGRTDHEIGRDLGLSGRTVMRLIALTNLIPELLEMVDDHKISETAGYYLSFLKKETQDGICDFCRDGGKITLRKAQELKELQATKEITEGILKEKLSNVSDVGKREVVIGEAVLRQYFSASLSANDIEKIIITLIKEASLRDKLSRS